MVWKWIAQLIFEFFLQCWVLHVFDDAWIIYGTWCHVVISHLQKLRPPTSGYAPQQKPRKQTSKRSWWDSGTSDLLKKWQSFWKFGCHFFSCKKTFCTGIRRASNSAGKISDLRWLCHAVDQGHQGPESCGFLWLGFQPPKERSFWMIEWLLTCLACTRRMVNQPFSVGDLEPWKKLTRIIVFGGSTHCDCLPGKRKLQVNYII